MSFDIFGEDKTLDVWLKNDIFPVKKKKRKENNGAEKAREVKHGERTVEKAWSALFYQ